MMQFRDTGYCYLFQRLHTIS